MRSILLPAMAVALPSNKVMDERIREKQEFR
jgi:hypothetical protein